MSNASDLGPLFGWISTNAEDRSRQSLFDNSGVIATDVGIVRKENQDRVAALHTQFRERSIACVALSDGMGGMQDGAACATLTLAALFQSLIRQTIEKPAMDGRSLLTSAVLYANNSVFENWKGKGGATLSAILIEPERPTYIINVGDSRIYGLDDRHREVIRLTIDDNLRDAFGGGDSRLVQFMGIGGAIVPKVEQLPAHVNRLLMTSDGTHYIDQDLFKKIIVQADDAQRAAERLLALARWLGGPDNASIAALNIAGARNFLRAPLRETAKIWSGQAQLSIIQSLGWGQGGRSDVNVKAYTGNDGNVIASGGRGGGGMGSSAMRGSVLSGTSTNVSLTTGGTGYNTPPPQSSDASRQAAGKTKRKRKSKIAKKEASKEQLEITISGKEEDDASHS